MARKLDHTDDDSNENAADKLPEEQSEKSDFLQLKLPKFPKILGHQDDDATEGEMSDREALAGEVSAKEAAAPVATWITRRGIFEDDWRAKVTDERPWPVILIHGTGLSKGVWQELGKDLREDGWAVFAPDYGFRATNPVNESLDHVRAYIHAVQKITGAEKVIVCGHSQGGLLSTMLSYSMPADIHHVVCISAPNHGTDILGRSSSILKIPGLPETSKHAVESLVHNIAERYFGGAGLDQLAGSETVRTISESKDLAPGVTYTCLASKTDQLINPPSSTFLEDDGSGRVTNMYVQDLYPRAVILHEDMVSDRRVRPIIREQLLALVDNDTESAEEMAGDGASEELSESRTQ